MAASPSDVEIKQHPFQVKMDDGITGAYEARLMRKGFYLRLDVPGVASAADVHLKPIESSRCIVIRASSAEHAEWSPLGKVRDYVACVPLDVNPTTVKVDKSVTNGVCRLLFHQAAGRVEFLPPRSTNVVDDNGLSFHTPIIKIRMSTFL